MDRFLPPTPSPSASIYSVEENGTSLDFNVIVILAAMLCALVCALGLNSMLKCVVRGTHHVITQPVVWVASRRLNSGLKKKDMVALPTLTYASTSGGGGSPSSSTCNCNCAICLVDFSDGDRIRVLPKCNHRFHVACIDTWLLSHSSCPTCRHQLKHNDSDNPVEIVTTT